MRPLVDPEALVAAAPPGSMLYATATLDGERQVVLFIREKSRRVRAVPASPPVEARAATFIERDAVIVPLLLRLAGELYESWWNYHQPDGIAPFELMTSQAQLPIALFGDRGRERLIAIPNRHAAFFAESIRLALARPPWTMAVFDAGRAAIERRHPTVAALWRALRAP